MVIKCALCGGEWENMAETGGYLFHPNSSCPLGDLDIPEFAVRSINNAIEAAKVDGRKPEECKYHAEDRQGYDWCEEYGMQCEGVCPCAAWEK